MNSLALLRLVTVSSYCLAALWLYFASAAACDGRYLAAGLFGVVFAITVVAWSSALFLLAEETRIGPD